MPVRLAWAATPMRAAFGALVLGMMVASQLRMSPGLAQAPASEGTVRLAPALTNTPAEGGPFTVYVVLENLLHNGVVTYDDNHDGVVDRSVSSNGLAAFQFTLTYDPAVVTIMSAEPGPDLGRSGRSFQCLPPARDPTTFTFGCISIGNTPDGTQGTLTLGAVEMAPVTAGLSPLQIAAEVTGPLGDAGSVTAVGGAVRVTGNAVAATRTPTVGGAQPTPVSTVAHPVTAGPAATAAALATATAASRNTAVSGPSATRAAAAPTPTAGGPKPPAQIGATDKSGSDGMWWAAGAGVAVGVAALSLGAVLWRRRQVGSQ